MGQIYLDEDFAPLVMMLSSHSMFVSFIVANAMTNLRALLFFRVIEYK